MSTPYESADLILKLYDMRREATLRDARQWFRHFSPDSAQAIVDTVAGPDSAKYRMVTTYWEMAAALVNHGAIDEALFNEANGEHAAVFSKVEPHIVEYRTRIGVPHYLANLENLVMRLPNASARLAALRDRLRATPKH